MAARVAKGYAKADRNVGDVSNDSMLYTLPEQQALLAYGGSKLRIKFYGGRALGAQARATHMQAIPALAYDCGGYVVQSKTFSDVAATLLLEIPRANLPRLIDVLSTEGAERDLRPTNETRDILAGLHTKSAEQLAEAGYSKENVGVVFRLEYPESTHEIRSEIGDLRKFMRPLGPVNLGGGAFPPEKRSEQKNIEATIAKAQAEERYEEKRWKVMAKRRSEREEKVKKTGKDKTPSWTDVFTLRD